MKEISELDIPEDLRFAKDHEWVSPGAPHRVGVSDFAQDQLGDLTYVELPEVGAAFSIGDEFGSLESIKSVSSLFMPVDAKIVAVNEALRDNPGLINSDPYGEGWLVEIELSDPGQLIALMAGNLYRTHLEANG